jgi:hypothetical protein
VNVTVGGFYRAEKIIIENLLPDLEWGFQAAQERFVSWRRLDFPTLTGRMNSFRCGIRTNIR